MKKDISYILLSIVLLFLVGCSSVEKVQQGNKLITTTKKPIKKYEKKMDPYYVMTYKAENDKFIVSPVCVIETHNFGSFKVSTYQTGKVSFFFTFPTKNLIKEEFIERDLGVVRKDSSPAINSIVTISARDAVYNKTPVKSESVDFVLRDLINFCIQKKSFDIHLKLSGDSKIQQDYDTDIDLSELKEVNTNQVYKNFVAVKEQSVKQKKYALDSIKPAQIYNINVCNQLIGQLKYQKNNEYPEVIAKIDKKIKDLESRSNSLKYEIESKQEEQREARAMNNQWYVLFVSKKCVDSYSKPTFSVKNIIKTFGCSARGDAHGWLWLNCQNSQGGSFEMLYTPTYNECIKALTEYNNESGQIIHK